MKRERKRDDIYAVESGEIILVLTTGAYGIHPYIRHADGSTAMYAHLQSTPLKVGDTVEGGEFIGVMGDTGNCPSGTHLHISYFGKYAKELRGEYANDPTFWVQLNHWPTNTKVSGGFGEIYKNVKGKEYPHEGIDFYYSKLINGWEGGNIDPMNQDMRMV
jgi:murein DD-endopeptidase MepM/ murein hydrolase activator NlpD